MVYALEDLAEKAKKLGVDAVNARLAMLAIIGMFFQHGRIRKKVARVSDIACEHSCTYVCVYSGGNGATPCDGG